MQLRWIVGVCAVISALGCKTDREPGDGPCPNGICVVDGGGGGCMNGQSCDDGNPCTTGDTCDASGACRGTPLVCSTPPAATCSDADTSLVFNPQGVCQAGQCSYTQNMISCPGACDATTGICPNACDMVTCDQPPSACFGVPGTCTNGACSYTPLAAGGACDDGDACTINGICQADGTCLENPAICDAPPANACMGNVLRVYSTQGAVCAAGACDYPFTDQACAQGCANGVCMGMCDDTTCDAWALPAQPNGTARRTCTDANCPTTLTLPALDENYFRCNVQPAFNISCAAMGCHATRTPQRRLRIYARMFSRESPRIEGAHIDGPQDSVSCGLSNCDVDPLTPFERSWNYDSARLFAAEAANPASSELLTQPLSASAGGLAHDGFDILQTTADARYQAMLLWMGGATESANCGGRQLPANGGPFSGLDDYVPSACVQ